MATSGPPSGRLPVRFDGVAFGEDLARYKAASRARRVADAARLELERGGVGRADLRRCEDEGPDGTRLGGARKLYLPLGRAVRDQPFGLVLLPAFADGELVLAYLAFGVRHQPRGARAPTVYAIAHRRLHGSWV